MPGPRGELGGREIDDQDVHDAIPFVRPRISNDAANLGDDFTEELGHRHARGHEAHERLAFARESDGTVAVE
ncbi:hypothetical protein [Glycomyces paridis]|uniref:Uncharacterized protein n=1 Tax=Glycomyces paridis TaxID=2126555 RepID=A0A4S8PIY3_9ACTN|nr:hypothetical protein [Glycomyces paridis]THV28359.1 hypothetical protein E9998_12175 [Glycomyces paridis]